MNKVFSFSPALITGAALHMAWASLEVLVDDVEEIQLMAAGDDNDVNDLKIEEKEGRLLVEQPTYGLTIKLNTERWMQILLRLPRDWKGAVEACTIAGPLRMRGVSGTDVVLDTVSGDIRASRLSAIALGLKTISGSMQAQSISCDQLGVRTVSGKVSLQETSCLRAKLNGVSGDQRLELAHPFEKLDVTTVSGDVEIYAPVREADISLRAVTGRVLTGGVNIVEGAAMIRGTSVSGNLAVHCSIGSDADGAVSGIAANNA